MSPSILTIKIYRSLHIAVLIPSHEDSLLVEWESSYLSLSIDLDWHLTSIYRLTHIWTLCIDRYGHATREFESFIFISVEIFVFIDFEE